MPAESRHEKGPGGWMYFIAPWTPILFIVLLLSLSLLWREMPTERKANVPPWNVDFRLAESWRQKRDPHRATFFYSQAFRIAAFADDWRGLIAVACGLQKLGRVKGGLVTAEAVLLRALQAAEQKRSRQAVRCAAEGLMSLGNVETASRALSRITDDWPLEENGGGQCWRCGQEE
jgi:hypothetical protein